MPIFGAHMSIAGGFHKAVDRAVESGCECLQVFTKNNNQWKAKPFGDDEATRFRDRLAETGLQYPLSHSSYLINLAAADEPLWNRSVDALEIELERAHRLGIRHVVLHPGAHTVLSEAAGLERVVRALDVVHQRTGELESSVLLENTAGQGTCLGWRFEQLAEIIGAVAQPGRLGVCLDTCHLHAAGYDLTTRSKFLATIRDLDRTIGLDCIRAVHVNDSKRELGARVDRHENIGQGQMGLEPFRLLVNDRRFFSIPMYLETPKGEHENGASWDEVNLRLLRSLVKS